MSTVSSEYSFKERNLKNLICWSKSKLLPNSFPGVYQLECTCNALNICETKKKVITRTIEHQQNSFNEKWESSGATEHCLEQNFMDSLIV